MEKYVKSLLNELGLEEEETKIYLAALELGQGNMKDLAYKANVKRTSAYNYVENLIKKRLLVSGKKKKRTVYSAVHPNQLIEIQKGRLNELDKIGRAHV